MSQTLEEQLKVHVSDAINDDITHLDWHVGIFLRVVRQQIAEELRKVPQVDPELETYLWKRIDELEGRS